MQSPTILVVLSKNGPISRMHHKLQEGAQQRRWVTEDVANGTEAIERLQSKSYDVLVTESKDGPYEGRALLAHVKDHFPSLVRVLVSTKTPIDTALRLLPIAHRCIAETAEPTELLDAIDNSIRLRHRLAEPNLQRLVGKISHLPSCPRTYTDVIHAFSDKGGGFQEATDIISRDPGLSTTLLRIANNSFFCRGIHIDDIRRALPRLGARVVRGVVLQQKLMSSFSNINIHTLQSLVDHAWHVGNIANEIADSPGLGIEFTAGLLHEVGLFVALESKQMDAFDLENRNRPGGQYLHAGSIKVDYSLLGAYVLGLWGLPDALVETVAEHRSDPASLPTRSALFVRLAELCLEAFENPDIRKQVDWLNEAEMICDCVGFDILTGHEITDYYFNASKAA